MKYSRIIKYDRLKKGFTLIELLAVIVILALIFSLLIYGVNLLLNDVDEKIDETTKNMILDVANEYAVEFRGTDDWEEQETIVDGRKTSLFCVSLDTLMEKGYFKNDKSNYDKYREKYAVRFRIVNGVSHYEFVELTDVNIEDSDVCKYAKRTSSLVIKDEVTGEYVEVDKITNDLDVLDGKTGENFGSLDYGMEKVEDGNYILDIDLNLNFYDVEEATNDVYVNLVLDGSGSMVDSTNGYVKSMNAMIPFSEGLLEKINDAQISLIGFGTNPKLLRGYASSALVEEDFYNEEYGNNKNGRYLGWTNVAGGLDAATSIIYRYVPEVSRNHVYTILLYDGAPTRKLSMEYYWNDELQKFTINGDSVKQLTPQLLYSLNGNSYEITGMAEKYFRNVIDITWEGTARNKDYLKPQAIINEETGEKIQYVPKKESSNTSSEYSANYLKNIGSKVIFLGYNLSGNSSIWKIASIDNEFCGDSNKIKDNNYYCYYELTSSNLNEKFEDLAAQIIENSSANKVNVIVEPVYVDGEPLISIIKDGVEINKVEEKFNLDEIELEDGKLNLSDTYQIKLNDALFDKIYCNEDSKICEFNDSLKLFDIKLVLGYPDESSSVLDVTEPEINVSLVKTSTLN